jgi:hypothetical protein
MPGILTGTGRMSFSVHQRYAKYSTLTITRSYEASNFCWSFLVGEKDEDKSPGGTKFDVIKPLGRSWTYRAVEVPDVRNAPGLIVRILIAKVIDERCLRSILRKAAVPLPLLPECTCRDWIKMAVEQLSSIYGVVRPKVSDWKTLDLTARQYAAQQTSSARFEVPTWRTRSKPTYSMLKQKEVVPKKDSDDSVGPWSCSLNEEIRF